MPYYHRTCGGIVPLRWPIRCKKCKKKWPAKTMFAAKPPSDMVFSATPLKAPKVLTEKGNTSYAKWGDKIPGVAQIASKMPKWPRWARILLAAAIVAGVINLINYIRG